MILSIPGVVEVAAAFRSGLMHLHMSTAMARFTGGCLCGKVRYRSDAEPILVGLCHCLRVPVDRER
ncbi:MAG TPA: hypothetical protein VHY82_03615 [Acetobacteraceae bacterium]|nr:hypothetical protein [Acetobacteraceae bacterium]